MSAPVLQSRWHRGPPPIRFAPACRDPAQPRPRTGPLRRSLDRARHGGAWRRAQTACRPVAAYAGVACCTSAWSCPASSRACFTPPWPGLHYAGLGLALAVVSPGSVDHWLRSAPPALPIHRCGRSPLTVPPKDRHHPPLHRFAPEPPDCPSQQRPYGAKNDRRARLAEPLPGFSCARKSEQTIRTLRS